jgi:lipoprotein-anchoring transpeptidase ErfK/SrfK
MYNHVSAALVMSALGIVSASAEPLLLQPQHRPQASINRPQAPAYVAPQSAYVAPQAAQARAQAIAEQAPPVRYGIGVGKPGFTWSGAKKISAKKEWPDWVPPPEMLERRPDLPHFMAGGPENPLGARAMYLGSSLYRIHGSNEPWTIGQAVSSGCIRMRNEDVIDLYERVKVGTKVVVI